MIRMILTAVLAAFLVTGCEALRTVAETGAEHAEVSRLAVKAGTLKYIEAEDDRSARASEVQAFIERARERVDAEAESTVDALADRVRDEVRWDELEMSEQLLVDELITAITETLREKMGEGPLTEEDRLRIKAVLDWAHEAAGLYAR